MEILIVMPLLLLVLGVGLNRALTLIFMVVLFVALFQHRIFAGVDVTQPSTLAAYSQMPWWLMTAVVGVATTAGWLLEMAGADSPLLSGFFSRRSK
ncbi:hypothetical protein [Burkholderia gladioli]|uniref:hypothetical protein n=1 Tax=Burkholderia gladioli TaxID=28095 RepID=UPI00164107F6|nr:hypothetical protein [Burkholderia gladioli]MBU9426467.1 hypothetical protein [Burkholderia gladioli]MDN8063428.1 hypothetical protein [Burkholderia gladioli]